MLRLSVSGAGRKIILEETSIMKYRVNRRTGDRISEIGLGTSYLYEAGHDEGVRTVRRAYDGGINYYDLAAGDGSTFPIFGDALSDVRKDVFYQIHFGADYTKGEYGWTLDLQKIKDSVAWQLDQLKTDYIDYGFIHCQDESEDWHTYVKNGVLDYILSLKKEGIVRHIGLSSHTPEVIREILAEGIADQLMFSLNPSYDYGKGEYAHGGTDERAELYRRCEAEGIGITVMKPFGGGTLLSDSLSPFGKALTPYQCIRYALDKPGVLCVLPGARSAEEVDTLLAYYEQPEEALDYTVISTFTPASAAGRCVYCNHCRPCPAGLDVGLINKYYDLAKAGDAMAAEHYYSLEHTAEDCVSCGHCDSRCPFGVKQSARMEEIRTYFRNR